MGDFFQILWPSLNILTLASCTVESFQFHISKNIFCVSKGQLISEGLFGVFKSTSGNMNKYKNATSGWISTHCVTTIGLHFSTIKFIAYYRGTSYWSFMVEILISKWNFVKILNIQKKDFLLSISAGHDVKHFWFPRFQKGWFWISWK